MNRSRNFLENTTTEDDSEKTAFEKFEQELKGTIFGVLFVLLKDEDTTFWKLVTMMFIDFVQLLNFPFNTSVNFPWYTETVLPFLQTFLNFFQIVSWCFKLNWTTYIVVFYLCIFLVCLVILDVFYVSYSFSKKKFAFVWPLQALRSTCGLFVTVLFLPLLGGSFFFAFFVFVFFGCYFVFWCLFFFVELFSSLLCCINKDGNLVHSTFTEVKCWDGIHILHASFSVVVSCIFICISMVVALTYFETKGTSNDPSARIHSRVVCFLKKTEINYYFYIGCAAIA